MKRVMVLGASFLQNNIIDAINSLGYYSIALDGNPECEKICHANEFYNLDFSKREEVLKLATKMNIDGILTYASDAAAPIVSYVAEQLGLYGNPYESTSILTNKAKTRRFLRENNFNVPASYEVTSYDDALKVIEYLQYPLIVKPVDSCGSRGLSKVNLPDDLQRAVELALDNSVSRHIVVENFIERCDFQYEIECYLDNGIIIYDEIMKQYQDKNVPFSPIGDGLPIVIDEKKSVIVKKELQRLLKLLHMQFGIFNVEFIFDKKGNLFFLEVAPRAGGNLISECNFFSTGFNMREALVRSTLGQSVKCEINKHDYVSCLLVHSEMPGEYVGIKYLDIFKGEVLLEEEFLKKGDSVRKFTGGRDGVGITICRFDTFEALDEFMNNSTKYIAITRNIP